MKELDLGLNDWELSVDERRKEMNVFTLNDLINGGSIDIDLDDIEELVDVIKFIKSYYEDKP